MGNGKSGDRLPEVSEANLDLKFSKKKDVKYFNLVVILSSCSNKKPLGIWFQKLP